MAKPTAQQCHALITYFIKGYEQKTGKKSPVSRNKVRYWFESILMDFTPTESKQLVDYYLQYYPEPSVEWFAFNYDKVAQAKDEHDENEAVALKRRQETEQRLKDWRERWKKS